jgi:hypothetical protein
MAVIGIPFLPQIRSYVDDARNIVQKAIQLTLEASPRDHGQLSSHPL